MNKAPKYLSTLGILLLAATESVAQDMDSVHTVMARFLPYIFIAIVILILAYAAKTLYELTMLFIKVKEDEVRQKLGLPPAPVSKPKRVNWWDRFYKRATDAVPVEKEEQIMLDHNYDGIRELDNNLPPWWLWLFYITIAFSGVYFVYYHMTPYGKSSTEKYEMAMAKAAAEIEEFRALRADLVDEDNLEVLTDDQSLEIGKSIYINNCAVCHLNSGAGSVGPNLTDNYWIHGGSISDVYKTVKYGVPEKGMISWQTQLRPIEMHQVSSYILESLVGTNPPDAKEPQGEEYVPEDADSQGTDAAGG